MSTRRTASPYRRFSTLLLLLAALSATGCRRAVTAEAAAPFLNVLPGQTCQSLMPRYDKGVQINGNAAIHRIWGMRGTIQRIAVFTDFDDQCQAMIVSYQTPKPLKMATPDGVILGKDTLGVLCAHLHIPVQHIAFTPYSLIQGQEIYDGTLSVEVPPHNGFPYKGEYFFSIDEARVNAMPHKATAADFVNDVVDNYIVSANKP